MRMSLEAARVNAGISKQDATERLGISLPTLASYEEYRTYPNALTIVKMLELYGIRFEDIRFPPSSGDNEN